MGYDADAEGTARRCGIERRSRPVLGVIGDAGLTPAKVMATLDVSGPSLDATTSNRP